jgi:hypothetical protein
MCKGSCRFIQTNALRVIGSVIGYVDYTTTSFTYVINILADTPDVSSARYAATLTFVNYENWSTMD